MALINRLLLLRPHSRIIPSQSFARFSSSSSSSDEPKPDPHTDATSARSSFSSYFRDVKASLTQQEPPPSNRPYLSPKPFSRSATTNPTPPSRIESFEEIKKNLSEFRRLAAAPSPRPASHAQPVSIHELYKGRALPKGENSDAYADQPVGPTYGFDAIRDSLKNLGASIAKNERNGIGSMNDSFTFPRLKQRPMGPSATESPVVLGGTGNLPFPVFGKEMSDKQQGGSNKDSMRTEFRRMYSYVELGEKLRRLRPDKDGNSSFSIAELNERLIKLREDEEKEMQSRGGFYYSDLRECLVNISIAEDDKKKSNKMSRFDVLGQISGTPNLMLSAPKENLIEKYFHPDNMSSEEKLKLELKKVRDEFKMSESDCGSARVQVAQLTTKIKHLSSVLHKKDKHSRKGLIAMVQRRKKLLKYLRRTDWDSYCLVLSKLGLRDNPDHKAYA